MKKYLLFFVLLTCFILPPTKISAQTNSIIPSIAIQSVEIEKTDFYSDDKVSGKITFLNTSNFDATDVDYKIVLSGEYGPDGIPKKEYDFKQISSNIFISANSRKEIDFEYVIPSNISGENLGISIIAYYGPVMLGWNHDIFNVKPGENIKAELVNINFEKAFLKLENFDREVGLEEGFVFPENGMELNAYFKSNKQKPIQVIPKIEVYKFDNLSEKIKEELLPTFTISQNKDQQEYKNILIFRDLRPGVYVSKIYFTQDNKQVSNPIQMRFMIDGDVATILDANINKYSIQRNEEFILSINYMGSPMNPQTGEIIGSGKDAKIIYVLKNENNQVVAEGEKTISLKVAGTVAEKIKANEASSDLYIDAKILSSDGVLLSEISRKISNNPNLDTQDIKAEFNFLMIIVVVLIILFIIIVGFYLKNKIFNKSSAIFFILVLSAFFIKYSSAALDNQVNYWLNYNADRGGQLIGAWNNPINEYYATTPGAAAVDCTAGVWISGVWYAPCQHEIGTPYVYVNTPIRGVGLNSEQEYYITGTSKYLGCLNAERYENVYLWNRAPSSVPTTVFNDLAGKYNPLYYPNYTPIIDFNNMYNPYTYSSAATNVHGVSSFSGTFSTLSFGPYRAPNKLGSFPDSIYIVSTKLQHVLGHWWSHGQVSGYWPLTVSTCRSGTTLNPATNECVVDQCNNIGELQTSAPTGTTIQPDGSCKCINGANDPESGCDSGSCSLLTEVFYNNQCNTDGCSNVSDSQSLSSLVNLNLQYTANGQCSCSNGANNPNGGCTACTLPLEMINGRCGSRYTASGLIESFLTKPGSILINRGSACNIDWKVKQEAIDYFTTLSCVINPGNLSQNVSNTNQIMFTSPSIQNTTEYTLTCSGTKDGETITDSEKAKCNINPSVQEI